MLAGAKPHICAQCNISMFLGIPCTTNLAHCWVFCLSCQEQQVWVLWSVSHGTDSHAFEAVNVCWACAASQTQQQPGLWLQVQLLHV